jgi:hypothetical protein
MPVRRKLGKSQPGTVLNWQLPGTVMPSRGRTLTSVLLHHQFTSLDFQKLVVFLVALIASGWYSIIVPMLAVPPFRQTGT